MAKLKIPGRARYRKRVGAFSSLNVRRDESVLDLSSAVRCYNFDFSSGALRDSYGISRDSRVPRFAARYWPFSGYSVQNDKKVEQYLYQYEAGPLAIFDSVTGDIGIVSGLARDPLCVLPYRLNSRDILLLSSKSSHLMTWDGDRLIEHADSPAIASMALHYERLFVVAPDEPTRVYFSDDLDPTNWRISSDGAGFIELLDERGAFNKVVSFANYLYIFRDHGISRITAYADQREFVAANLFVSSGRIYPDSVVQCGSVIMFLASDGLYTFDGYDCKKTLPNLDGLFGSGAVCGAYHNGKYFLSCKMDFKDDRQVGCETGEYKANALFVYEVQTGEYSITRGLDIDFMNSCNYMGKDYLMAHESSQSGIIDDSGKRFGAPLARHWESPLTDLGSPDKTKTVRDVYIDSSVDCSVTFTADGKKHTSKVKAGSRRVRMAGSGRRIGIEIDTDATDCDIHPPSVIYTTD